MQADTASTSVSSGPAITIALPNPTIAARDSVETETAATPVHARQLSMAANRMVIPRLPLEELTGAPAQPSHVGEADGFDTAGTRTNLTGDGTVRTDTDGDDGQPDHHSMSIEADDLITAAEETVQPQQPLRQPAPASGEAKGTTDDESSYLSYSAVSTARTANTTARSRDSGVKAQSRKSLESLAQRPPRQFVMDTTADEPTPRKPAAAVPAAAVTVAPVTVTAAPVTAITVADRSPSRTVQPTLPRSESIHSTTGDFTVHTADNEAGSSLESDSAAVMPASAQDTGNVTQYDPARVL